MNMYMGDYFHEDAYITGQKAKRGEIIMVEG